MTVRVKGRALLPAAGAVAAVATAVSGWAPIAQSSPTSTTHDAGLRAPAQDADGTFESCGAYFGFGKSSDGVLDVVAFDVSDQNGDDGISHSVPLDTQVVLVLTNDQGETLECEPEEVTEQQWDDAMDDVQISMPEGKDFPAWPGPGHFMYPSISYDPFIDGFGDVVGVAFRVADIPSGEHTLVSPTDVRELEQHYFTGTQDYVSFDEDQRVLEVIQNGAGPAAVEAFAAALAECDQDNIDTVSDDLADAINALLAFRGFDPEDADSMGCLDVGVLNVEVATLLGIAETAAYVEPIVLALPDEATTTTTSAPTTSTSTTIPIATEPDAATPIPGSPTYTG